MTFFLSLDLVLFAMPESPCSPQLWDGVFSAQALTELSERIGNLYKKW